MTARKGVFIGAYVPQSLKESLQQQARSEHRTLSQQITRILELHMRGSQTHETPSDLLVSDDHLRPEINASPMAQKS